MNEPQGLLTWIDIAKLSFPVGASFAIVFARDAITISNKRRKNQLGLFDVLGSEIRDYSSVVKMIAQVRDDVSDGARRDFHFQLSESIYTVASELIELDPGGAKVYGRLCARVKIVNLGAETLHEFYLHAVKHVDSIPSDYAASWNKQIERFRVAFKSLAEAEVETIEYLAAPIRKYEEPSVREARVFLQNLKDE